MLSGGSTNHCTTVPNILSKNISKHWSFEMNFKKTFVRQKKIQVSSNSWELLSWNEPLGVPLYFVNVKTNFSVLTRVQMWCAFSCLCNVFCTHITMHFSLFRTHICRKKQKYKVQRGEIIYYFIKYEQSSLNLPIYALLWLWFWLWIWLWPLSCVPL